MKKKISDDGNTALYETDKDEELLLKFNDDIIDGRGNVKAKTKLKGTLNAQLAQHLFKLIDSYHIPTPFKSQPCAKELLCKDFEQFPFKIVVTNVEKNEPLESPQLQYFSTENGRDREIAPSELVDSQVLTPEQGGDLRRMSLKLNVILKDFFQRRRFEVHAFEVQFGMIGNRLGLCSPLTLDTVDLKDMDSVRKFSSHHIASHAENADELYEEISQKLLF